MFILSEVQFERVLLAGGFKSELSYIKNRISILGKYCYSF